MGVSSDAAQTLAAFVKENGVKHPLLSDYPRRQMLKSWGVMEMNPESPIQGYAKRAYFIVDRQGTVKFVKVMDRALDLLEPADLLQALKASGS